MSVLGFYFGWPLGAIWSNLLASVIAAVAVWWRVRVRMIAHHAELVAQAAIHHAERLAQAERHHAGLQAHITATVTAAARPPKRLAPRADATTRPPPQ